MNCAIKKCKKEISGLIEVSRERNKEFEIGKVGLCQEHYEKIYRKAKEIERRELGENKGWAYLPIEKFYQAIEESRI